MTNSTSSSGDGSRPTTSGGVDNIGAGEKFTGKHNPAGEDIGGPAPKEKMQEKRKDAESSKHDDSSAFDLRENPEPVPNTEPATPEQVISTSDPSRRD
ncbi:MAG: hypothetical protein JWQ73_1230 [Variovorax sp.]|nr:hypothetical protein [Variovorax sp.]